MRRWIQKLDADDAGTNPDGGAKNREEGFRQGDPGSTPRGANFNERDTKAAVTNPLNIR